MDIVQVFAANPDIFLITVAILSFCTANLILPGFAVDCLETLEEIAIRGREIFLHEDGESLRYIDALNTNPLHIDALSNLIYQ